MPNTCNISEELEGTAGAKAYDCPFRVLTEPNNEDATDVDKAGSFVDESVH